MSNSTSPGEDDTGRIKPLKSTAEDTLADTDEAVDDILEDEYCSILDDFGCEALEEILFDKLDTPRRYIRLQGAPDECLEGIKTPEDVFQKIQQVRESQSEYGRADLYARSWQPTTSYAEDDVIDMVNGAVNGAPSATSHASFSVMQFNTLAEGLSTGPDTKRPFNCEPAFIKDNKKNNFGGFTNIQNPEIALDFNLRRWRLLEVILEKGALSDIVALEEVDRYFGFFLPVLKLFGYQGIFMPKIRAPGINLGWYSDGCALLWRNDTFDLVSERRLVYEKGTQVLVLATLQHRETGEYLVVAASHLKASRTVENEQIRCQQVEELLFRVEEQVRLAQTAAGKDKQVRILVLGDFNADPPDEAPGKNSCVRMVLHHGRRRSEEGHTRFQSTVPVDPPVTGYFTTWKTRGTETVQRVIDYIFHSENINCTHTLAIPEISEIEADQLPSLRYPSDHLMIAAKFKF